MEGNSASSAAFTPPLTSGNNGSNDNGGNSPSKEIVIVGAGIMGASVAYHLGLRGRRATVLEASGVASAASGKAGGFLARDWCGGGGVDALARLSFDMHARIAESLGEDVGYRRMKARAVSLAHAEGGVGGGRRRRLGGKGSGKDEGIDWLDGGVRVLSEASQLGDYATCAQVTPRLLTEALLRDAERRAGTQVEVGKVSNVVRDGERWSVHVKRSVGEGAARRSSGDNDDIVAADIVVLCMGPWSIEAKKWFPSLPAVTAHKAASVTVRGIQAGDTALFTQYTDENGNVREPEVYPRRDEVYVCASARCDDLPPLARDISVHREDATFLHGLCSALSAPMRQKLLRHRAGRAQRGRGGEGGDGAQGVSEGDGGDCVTQACYLPVSADGTPLVGAVVVADGVSEGEGGEGVFIATGHSCWGILNGPASGLLLSELIVDGEVKSVGAACASALRPARFVEGR